MTDHTSIPPLGHTPAPVHNVPAPSPHHPAPPAPVPAPAPPVVVPAPKPAPAPVPAPPAPVPAPVGVKAISSRAFIDSLGVNVHVAYMDTVYGNVPKIGDSLLYLGITKFRDCLLPWVVDRHAALVKRGLRANYFLPGRRAIYPDIDLLESFAKANPGAVVSLEGQNEVNNWGTPWPQDSTGKVDMASQAALHKAFYAKAQTLPNLKGLPLYAPSVTAEWAAKGLGDLRGFATHANAHIYFGEGGVTPRGNNFWRDTIAYNQQPCRGLPTVITETGYSTNVNGPQGVDEITQAKHSLNLLMDAAKDGIAATFFYELADQKNATNDPNIVDREGRFGLFRRDWTPKPAATAIRNLTSVLRGSLQNLQTTPGSLAYSVAGLPATGQHQLFQTGDGFVVAIWAEPDIWEEGSNKPIPAPASDVTVSFGKPVASWEVFDPLVADKAVTFGSNTSSARARVSDHVVLVRVKP